MRLGYWMENAMSPGRHTLVDLGPVSQAEARFTALRKHIGSNAFEIVGNRRLVARIPQRKVTDVLAALPEIQEGKAGYCWCTHGWVEVEHRNPCG